MLYIDFFDRGASSFPDEVCLIDGAETFTFRQVAELTTRIADGLIRDGVGPDEVVATFTPNSARGYACQWGAIRAGTPWMPVNTRNSVVENIAILNRMRARVIFFDSSLAMDVKHMLAEVPTLRSAIAIDAATGDAPALDKWMPAFGELAVVHHPRSGADVVAIPSTSGTSGKPKGVVLTNDNFQIMMANYQSLQHYDTRPVTLAAAPMTHAAGYFAATTLPRGGSIVMLRSADPLAIMEAIEKYRVTTVFMPPTLVYMLLAHPRVRDFDYSSLRYLIYGGAPMSVEKLKEARDVFGPVLAHHYAQTEAAVVIAYMTPQEHEEAMNDVELAGRLTASGRPGPFTKVAIMDDEGHLLPNGQAGEIVVQSGMVMKEYFEDPEETARVSEHGWHHTGDIGIVDDEGYVHVVDRKKDMIISGGFNVYPSEVEQVLWRHPSVQDCAVIGVPDEKWGEAVTAVLQLKDGATVDEHELLTDLRQQLGGVKTPKQVLIWDELPRSGAGKVLKREIRSQFWADHERKI